MASNRAMKQASAVSSETMEAYVARAAHQGGEAAVADRTATREERAYKPMTAATAECRREAVPVDRRVRAASTATATARRAHRAAAGMR
jgi:hypothetical protein